MTLPNTPPLRKYYHIPFKHTFEEVGDGTVRVTDDNGDTGLFKWTGEYIEGEITQANLHMLFWCGGPDVAPGMNFRWVEYPIDFSRPSYVPEAMEPHIPSAATTAKWSEQQKKQQQG